MYQPSGGVGDGFRAHVSEFSTSRTVDIRSQRVIYGDGAVEIGVMAEVLT